MPRADGTFQDMGRLQSWELICFNFFFQSTEELDKVLNSRPWLYDNAPFILRKWEKSSEKNNGAFTKTLMWFWSGTYPCTALTKM